MLGRSAMPAQTHVLTDAEIVLRDGVLPWYSWNQMAVSRGAVIDSSSLGDYLDRRFTRVLPAR